MADFIHLKPVIPPTEWMDEIERRIREEFKKRLYFPLLKIIQEPKNSLQNTIEDETSLWAALQSGKITFNRGTFSGKFDARTTRALKGLGATWDRNQSTFKLGLNDMPIQVQQIVQATQTRFEKKLAAIDIQLAKVVPSELAEQIQLQDLFDKTIFKVDSDFRQNVKNITIEPKLTQWQRDKISKEWTNNIKLSIQDWGRKEIKTLRANVEKAYFAGDRYGTLVGQIQTSYGQSARHALFLARQETKLLTSKYTESRYLDAGIPKYTWRTVIGSPLHPVRPVHKELEGTIQRWDRPPITTDVKGKYGKPQPERRNNPGEDYGCRCRAVPLVEFAKAS